MISSLDLMILFFVAIFSGFLDAIAGGGGLITLPVLLSVGLSPAEALGTNKLQSSGGSFSASLYFVRKKLVNLSDLKVTIFFTFAGSALGALMVQLFNPVALKSLLPFLLLAIAGYFLFFSTSSIKKSRLITWSSFALTFGLGIGFYDGFLGPGTGSFFTIAFVAFLGLSLIEATAHAKVLNFASNFGSLLVFILGGFVAWYVGLVMLVGQLIGARIGAMMVLVKGHRIIRPLAILVSIAMSVKLLLAQYAVF